MSQALQDTMSRISSKTQVLVERYGLLKRENDDLNRQLAEARDNNRLLQQQVEHLKREVDYLTMARNIAPTPERVAQSRQIISRLVRDIDKCIAQLNT